MACSDIFPLEMVPVLRKGQIYVEAIVRALARKDEGIQVHTMMELL